MKIDTSVENNNNEVLAEEFKLTNQDDDGKINIGG